MTSPLPPGWADHGAPPEAIAAYFEGSCPVHRTGLWPGHLLIGPRPCRLVAAGWCDWCEAWWHRPYHPGLEHGLGVTWDQGQRVSTRAPR